MANKHEFETTNCLQNTHYRYLNAIVIRRDYHLRRPSFQGYELPILATSKGNDMGVWLLNTRWLIRSILDASSSVIETIHTL
jgi:hypothetical protein